jgi:hypothetical protein
MRKDLPMSLASKGTPPVARRGPTCDTCRTLQALPDADADVLAGWFEEHPNTDKVNRWISDQLRDEGYHVGPASLDRHRRGGCRGTV